MTSYTPDRTFLGLVVSVAATLAVAGIILAAATDNAIVSTISGAVIGASCVAGLAALVVLIRSYVVGRRTSTAPSVPTADQDTLDALEPLRAAQRTDPR